MLNFLKRTKKQEYKNKTSYRDFVHKINFGNHIGMNNDYNSLSNEGYKNNVIVFRSVNMVASSVASINMYLYTTIDGTRIRNKDHYLNGLLRKPNQTMSFVNFLSIATHYYLISGNVYIFTIRNKNGTPVELHILRPDRVKISYDNERDLFYYEYTVDGSIIKIIVDKKKPNQDILHIKTFNPLNDLYGCSSIEAAKYSIEQHNQANEWNTSMLRNAGRPSGALVHSSGNISDEQYIRLKEQINEYYTGASNAGRPILLEGGLDWREMSLSPKDMDYIECKNSAARDIALAIGVPPQLLGIPGDNHYANLVETRIALWEQTVLPIFETIMSNLNNWLNPYIGKEHNLGYNRDEIEVLKLKRDNLWKYVQDATFMTINEKREMFALQPIEGGNKI